MRDKTERIASFSFRNFDDLIQLIWAQEFRATAAHESTLRRCNHALAIRCRADNGKPSHAFCAEFLAIVFQRGHILAGELCPSWIPDAANLAARFHSPAKD